MGYSLCIVAIFGDFQNAIIFRILAVFVEPFFAQNNCNVFKETFFACFRQFDFLTQTEYFAWAIYCLCIVAIFGHFQNALIFRILAVFSNRFLHRTTVMCLKKRFSHVLGNFIF